MGQLVVFTPSSTEAANSFTFHHSDSIYNVQVKASLRQRAAKRIISGFGSQVEKKKAAVVERPLEVFFEVSTGGGEKHVTNSFLVPVLSDVTMLHLRVPFPVQNYGLNAM